jgi:ketosteroid isomerase-like protein
MGDRRSPRIERLARTYEAFNDGDLEAAFDIADPAITWQTPTEFPGAPRFDTRDDARDFFATALAAFSEFRIEVERYVEDGDRVAVVQVHRAVGAGSGLPTQRRMAHLWTFEGERAVAFRAYLDADEALAELRA